MSRINIKTFLHTLIGTIIISCANSKLDNTNKNSELKLIKTEKLVDYKLLSYSRAVDTFMVVAKNEIDEKCIRENLIYISIQGNRRIDNLKDKNGKEISFVYSIKGGENNQQKILTGSGKPNNSTRKINSYNSYPYVVEICKPLKTK